MDIFVLGIERSATTWMANILEANYRTEVFMEPLSSYTNYFNHWPNRFHEIRQKDQMAEYFRKEFSKIRQDKRYVFTNFFNSNLAWKLDMKIADFFSNKLGYSKEQNFVALNFHRKYNNVSIKKERPIVEIIKELRLNFNADILKSINSNVKVIIIVRHYAPTIKSIVKYVNKGRLKELRELLKLNGNEGDYKPLFDYWIRSYNNLIKGLQSANIPFYLTSHKKMLKSTSEEIENIFTFLKLDLTDKIIEYADLSNTSGFGIHSTKRDHKELLEREEKDKKEMSSILKNRDRERLRPLLRDLI